MRYLIVTLLMACGGSELTAPPPPVPVESPKCSTPCGLLSATCTDLVKAEKAVLEAFRSIYPPEKTCVALQGILVVFEPPPNVPGAAGDYSAADAIIWLDPAIPLADGPFAHEIAHVLDVAYTPELAARDAHFEWKTRFGFAIQAYWIIMDR